MDPTKPRDPPVQMTKLWALMRTKAVTLAEDNEIKLEAILEALEIVARSTPNMIRLALTARREVERLPFPWHLGIAIAPKLDAIEKVVIAELDRPALLLLPRAPAQTDLSIVISHGIVQQARVARAFALEGS